MLNVTITSGTQDLQQILKLQKKNLIRNLSKEEIQSQGFVTVDHSLEVLEKMNQLAPSVIIKDQEQVVAYALTMLCESKDLVPELESMFERLASLQWKNKQLNAYSYYVMGQICIDKDYRGQGLFDQLYQKHREVYQSRFHFIVTEVATRNLRSLKAHLRVGFETINTYTDELDEWAVVVWDWRLHPPPPKP
jgi:GNAT superfamily N-acetyltransferase